jgi:hypothetical protein
MARYMEKGETIKFPMETFSLKSSDSWLKGVGALTCEARVARHLEGGRYAYHRGDWKVSYNWKRGYVENGGLSRHLSPAGSRLGYQVQPLITRWLKKAACGPRWGAPTLPPSDQVIHFSHPSRVGAQERRVFLHIVAFVLVLLLTCEERRVAYSRVWLVERIGARDGTVPRSNVLDFVEY